jgi:endonuclease G, mitochondrial
MKAHIILICSLFLFFQQIHAQKEIHRPEIHCKHFIYGYPYGTPITNDLIIRDIYALSNNDETKFADWVAYRLTFHEVDSEQTIERVWKEDPYLDENETLEDRPDDYKNANQFLKVDRGHQAPLASFKGSIYASQTNYLSNITPQKSALNQGPWVALENDVRNLVRTGKTVYVMTGPVFERKMPSLPEADESHKIPSGYWKIICVEENKELKVAAFFFDQETPRKDKAIDHLTTVDIIEAKTGLDFFWMLEDSEEIKLEKTIQKSFAELYFRFKLNHLTQTNYLTNKQLNSPVH